MSVKMKIIDREMQLKLNATTRRFVEVAREIRADIVGGKEVHGEEMDRRFEEVGR